MGEKLNLRFKTLLIVVVLSIAFLLYLAGYTTLGLYGAVIGIFTVLSLGKK